MARNVEIKARIASIEALLPRAWALADGVRVAEHLMHELGLAGAPRIAGAYLDLLGAA